MKDGNSKIISSLLNLLLENSPDLLWAKDLEKKFLFANKKACEMLFNVKDTSEVIGKTDSFFVKRARDLHPDRKDWHTF